MQIKFVKTFDKKVLKKLSYFLFAFPAKWHQNSRFFVWDRCKFFDHPWKSGSMWRITLIFRNCISEILLSFDRGKSKIVLTPQKMEKFGNEFHENQGHHGHKPWFSGLIYNRFKTTKIGKRQPSMKEIIKRAVFCSKNYGKQF